MKTIGANNAAHLANTTHKIAHIVRIVRTDSTEKTITDHDADVVVSGKTYKSGGGYSASALSDSENFSPGNLEILGIFDSAEITESDIRAGLYNGADVYVSIVNWSSPSDGAIEQLYGKVGEITIKNGVYIAQLYDIKDLLSQSIGRIQSGVCDAILGDSRCGVNLATYTVSGSVTSFDSRSTFYDTARTEIDDYFAGGIVTWTSGLNNGLQMEIESNIQSTFQIHLSQPMPYDIAASDSYSMTPGCNHLLRMPGDALTEKTGDCKTKYDNVINFRGFPDIPGNDIIISGE